MIEKYGLFDSLEGDEREYAEADLALLVKALRGDGVRGGETALKVTPAASGLAVNVAEGLATVQGRYYALENDGSGEKALNMTAASGNPRIDRVVLRLNYAQRTVTLGILKGTEAASPKAPELTRNTTEYMLSLAQVYVTVGATSIGEEDITDERKDGTLCGLYLASADEALSAAKNAEEKATDAQQAAKNAQGAAETAAQTAKKAQETAEGKMGKPEGVTEGELPKLDANGNIVGSGYNLSQFTLAKIEVVDGVLYITTLK